MPVQQTVTLYEYSELSDDAKSRARDACRGWATSDEWYDGVYEDALDLAGILGIDIKDIYFSGFYSQGDGACYTGRYEYKAGCGPAIKAAAPTATELHELVDRLVALQSKHFYKLYAQIEHRGHYYHSGCMSIDVMKDGEGILDYDDTVEELTQLLRELADFFYKTLEKEYEYLTSDEQVAEMIEANAYLFTEEGQPE